MLETDRIIAIAFPYVIYECNETLWNTKFTTVDFYVEEVAVNFDFIASHGAFPYCDRINQNGCDPRKRFPMD